MDFAYSPEDIAFRDELRAWLDENLPKFLADWGGDEDLPPGGRAGGTSSSVSRSQERRKDWQRRLNEGRWAAINWPKDWGGREATPVQNVIYAEEKARVRAPGIYNANGIWQIGPMIIKWGTDEQKQRWLPGILDASEHWCQGFSEPEAGSDLANLRTTAIRDGDEYVVNGQKIWISTAHLAEWGLFLLRTDPDAIERGAKHEGITAFIINMDTPGIECRPIRDIAGDEMFNEVWFTDARIPADCRLGEEGQGWQVAMGTLGHERVGTAGLAITMAADLRSMISAAKATNPDAFAIPRSASGSHGRSPTSSSRSCSTTGRSRRSSRARRTGPRSRWPSCSGATSPRRSPSSRSTCSARRGCSPRAGPTPSTAAPGRASTRSSATRRSAPAPPRCRRTSSPTAPCSPASRTAIAEP